MTLAATAARGQARPAPQGGSDQQIVSEGLDREGHLKLTVNKTAVITTRVPYKRVSVGQPDIADVNPIGPGNILVTAKKMGNTQVIIWDDSDRSQVIDVTVDFDMQAMQEQLKAMFPDSKIDVTALNGAIALRGHVPNLQTADQAVAVASPFSQKVLNFLDISGGQQIMLSVRFAEVSRGAIAQLGVHSTAIGPGYTFTFNNGPGPSRDGGLALGQPITVDPTVTAYGAARIGDWALETFLSALKTNNLARVLAEPNVVVMSGQEANFLAGGEIPVPVPQANGGAGTTITIEYKQFGVSLNVAPVVLGDGRVRMRVKPEVSQLDFSNAVTLSGTQIPALTTRTVQTTVELGNGQTFAIAGLLNDTVQANSASTPYLGDVPVLGALFRSVRYERKETELMVLVTPRLVAPLNPDKVPAIPGEHWRHPKDGEVYWLKDLGNEINDTGKPSATTKRPTSSVGQGQQSDAPTANSLEPEAIPQAAANPETNATAQTNSTVTAPAATPANNAEPPARFGGDYGFTPSTAPGQPVSEISPSEAD